MTNIRKANTPIVAMDTKSTLRKVGSAAFKLVPKSGPGFIWAAGAAAVVAMFVFNAGEERDEAAALFTGRDNTVTVEVSQP